MVKNNSDRCLVGWRQFGKNGHQCVGASRFVKAMVTIEYFEEFRILKVSE